LGHFHPSGQNDSRSWRGFCERESPSRSGTSVAAARLRGNIGPEVSAPLRDPMHPWTQGK
jgi:hypothetical protein